MAAVVTAAEATSPCGLWLWIVAWTLMVRLASEGNVQTQTVPAHTAAEREMILAAAGK
jgi:uncharacterized protein with GYD domain